MVNPKLTPNRVVPLVGAEPLDAGVDADPEGFVFPVMAITDNPAPWDSRRILDTSR